MVRHGGLVEPTSQREGEMDQRPLSPDGKYWWDGQKWNPVEQPAQPQPPRLPQRRSRWLTLPWVLIGLVLHVTAASVSKENVCN